MIVLPKSTTEVYVNKFKMTTNVNMLFALHWTTILFSCLLFSKGEEVKSRCPKVCEDNQRAPTTARKHSAIFKSPTSEPTFPNPITIPALMFGSKDPEFQFFALALALVKPETATRLLGKFNDKKGREVDWSMIWQEDNGTMNYPLYFHVIFQVTDLLRSYADKNKNDSVSSDLYKLWRLADAAYMNWWRETTKSIKGKSKTAMFGTDDRRQLVVYIWQKTTEDLAELFNTFCNSVCYRNYIIHPFLLSVDYSREHNP